MPFIASYRLIFTAYASEPKHANLNLYSPSESTDSLAGEVNDFDGSINEWYIKHASFSFTAQDVSRYTFNGREFPLTCIPSNVSILRNVESIPISNVVYCCDMSDLNVFV